ncbi:hypothetical protein V8G54_032029 [Vigna mungo]|uniref:Benzyl alcohol O-benzoyltransferase n=1 Tax=Vigna mungo TaxID=3915 RepID=A0AAQ3MKJ5_VIGMU
MCDGHGYEQFMSTWAEMARGATKPSVAPLWRRGLLMARDPPRITYNHREFEQHCTTFDLITACLWRCRTKALQIEAGEDVRMMFVVNARGRFNPPLPFGYYGNAFAYPAAVTTAGKLCRKPFGYAVELINKVKGEMTEEYLRSVADLMVMKGRCLFTTVRSCIVSSLARFNLREVNFGWGEAVYGGVAHAGLGQGIIFPIWLPAEAMERFAEEFNHVLGNKNQPQNSSATFTMSTL